MAEDLDLNNESNINWVRAAYGLKFLQEGLAGFVERQAKLHHEDLLQSYIRDTGYPASMCSTCSSDNLLPQHPLRNCIQKSRSRCFCNTWKTRRKCPNNFCSRFYDNIVYSHAEGNPLWENTDPTRWYSDHWELAKCYLGTTGYEHSQASTTDATGLLSIVINDLFIHDAVDNLDSFKEARRTRNEIMHRKIFDVTNDEVKVYIDRMIAVLQDKKCLLHDVDAKNAVEALQKLQNNTLTINVGDITNVVNESIKESVDKQQKDALLGIQQYLSRIQQETIATLEKVASTTKLKILEEIEKKSDEQKRELTTLIYTRQSQIDPFDNLVNDLKEDLIDYYIENEYMISASPIVDEHVVPLLELYVQPSLATSPILGQGMNKYTHFNLPGNKDTDKKKISSYKELFFKEDNTAFRKIYITADAGMGKTSFSQMVALTWCKAQKPVKLFSDQFTATDLTTMGRFEVMFLLHLRDYQGVNKCNLDDILFDMVSKKMSRSCQYSKDFLQKVLHQKKCLILCDGLDEWSHPVCCSREPAVPHNNHPNSCTTLTTTRSWKLATVGLPTNQVDNLMEISELNEETSDKLKANAIQLLYKEKDPKVIQRYKDDFNMKLKSVDLKNIVLIPYILLQLLCLWFDRLQMGKSKCEIYSNITEMTITRGLKKKSVCELQLHSKQNLKIPRCITINQLCTKHMHLLLKLGELAFFNLFDVNKESRLLIDKDHVSSHLTDNEINFCLNVGLLSQAKNMGFISKRCYYVLFQHKSIQEFFAAIYITSHWKSQTVQTTVLKVCSSLENILEMSEIFVFISGMNSEVYSSIFHELQNVVARDNNTVSFREINNDDQQSVFHTLYLYQEMHVSCVAESKRNKNVCTSIPLQDILHAGFKSKEDELLVINRNNNNIRSLHICTYAAPCVKTGVFNTLQTLRVMWFGQSAFIQKLITKQKGTLKYLEIRCLPMDDCTSTCDMVIEPISRLNNLQYLSLNAVTTSHRNLERLSSYICNQRPLWNLELNCLICSDHNKGFLGDISHIYGLYTSGLKPRCFALDLCHLDMLKRLTILFSPLSDLQVNTSSLEYYCTDDFVKSLLEMQGASLLTSLSLKANSQFSYAKVFQTISTFPQLKELEFSYIDMKANKMSIAPEMKRLEIVRCSDVKMTPNAWRELFTCIGNLCQSVAVEINTMYLDSPKEWMEIMDEIKAMTKFTVSKYSNSSAIVKKKENSV